jgi:hypothetical protein
MLRSRGVHGRRAWALASMHADATTGGGAMKSTERWNERRSDSPGNPRASRTGDRWRNAAAVGVVLTVCAVVCPAKLIRPGATFDVRENAQIAEAKAWWGGRFDLPERGWDTALKDGKVYSHFPPLFSAVAAILVSVFDGVPHWFVVLFVATPVPVLAYLLFRRRGLSEFWAATAAIGLVCGTSALPVIDKTLRGGSPYFINQTLAMIGVLLILCESFGRRRVWLAGVGLVIAALSRQLTIVYAMPFALVVLGGRENPRRSDWVALFATALVVVVVPLTLNALKFGDPFDAGYMHVYADRPEDRFSRDAKSHGLFSPRYVARNLYHANFGFPDVHRIEVAGAAEIHLRPNEVGTGIWWTTPLLLWLLVDIRRLLRDPDARIWLIAAMIAFGGLMLYHSTGYVQRGFNRYSLDYVPVLAALVAPRCFAGWRRWVSAAMIAWSVVYFRWLI